MTASADISWFSDPRKWFRAMLMLDDSSHRIALGAAIGMFIAMTPTVGVQMVLVLTFALLTRPFFRFNKVAALLMVYVSNPLTVVPIYWFNYKLGLIYFPGSISRQEFEKIFQYEGLSEWWSSLTRLFVEVGVPLVAGSLVMATCCGLATYPIVLRVIRNLRRAERKALREAKVAKRRDKQERDGSSTPLDPDAGDDATAAESSSDPAACRSPIGAEQQAPV